MHVLGHLKGTIEYRITYQHGTIEDDSLTPIGYVDSSHSDDRTTGKSTMRYVFMMVGGPVSWSSRSQKQVALSTSEAEYVATVHGADSLCGWVHTQMSSRYTRTNLIH